MPYIHPNDRPALDEGIREPRTPGELNYMVTKLTDKYMQRPSVKLNYDLLNECIGVLECAKQELLRRVVAPYEDKKCADNGDVYTHRS